MNQVFNPYLPLYEYIPDGEPHVFGERLYVYGSHDRFDGKKFCMNDYVCWSASVTDLTDWHYEGVIFRKIQDPRMPNGEHEMWAPDVVQGKDGRYYLYYCPDDTVKSIGVAVCGEPAGEYEFLGLVKDRNGGVLGERPGDTIPFDPGVFVDDDGEIYLYSGNGPRTQGAIGKEPKASMVMTLQDDMLTLKTEPRKLLPTLGESAGTGFEGHEFFEASSIRKIGGRYYLVYSSVTLHELCYAVSDRPDGNFQYGGVIVSNCDLFPGKGGKPLNNYGNNHGGLECIDGKFYIFYHRQTNRSMFSRQGCAEQVQIMPDGSIPQVEITSCGLNGGPLQDQGTYSATICCNLYGKHEPTISHSLAMGRRHPYITQDGPDWSPEDDGTPPEQYITNCKNGFVAGYKYFEINSLKKISITLRGSARGKLLVCTDLNNIPVGEITVSPYKDWQSFSGAVDIQPGKHPLYLCFEGRGKLDLLEITLM